MLVPLAFAISRLHIRDTRDTRVGSYKFGWSEVRRIKNKTRYFRLKSLQYSYGRISQVNSAGQIGFRTALCISVLFLKRRGDQLAAGICLSPVVLRIVWRKCVFSVGFKSKCMMMYFDWGAAVARHRRAVSSAKSEGNVLSFVSLDPPLFKPSC